MPIKNWTREVREAKLSQPVALVGSPGLRSVGLTAVDYLVKKLPCKLFLELYSGSFPAEYALTPSYIATPGFPGSGGVVLRNGSPELPRVEFHSWQDRVIVVKGYQADFEGQYQVAETIIDHLHQLGTRRVVVLAAHGKGGEGVQCAATDKRILKEMAEHGIEIGYEGPFFGLSGLILGIALTRGIEGLALFGLTTAMPEDPEFPDPAATKTLLEKVSEILNLPLDLSELELRIEKKTPARKPELCFSV
jgi:proteasome assembly chaperone (PAC2) family protein